MNLTNLSQPKVATFIKVILIDLNFALKGKFFILFDPFTQNFIYYPLKFTYFPQISKIEFL